MVQFTFATTVFLSLLTLAAAQTCPADCAAASTVTVYQCTTSAPLAAAPASSETSMAGAVAVSSARPVVTTASFPTTSKVNSTVPTTPAMMSGATTTSNPSATFTGAANALSPVVGLVGLGLGALAML